MIKCYNYWLPKAKSTGAEVNPFKYGGKELTTDMRTPFYDFEARVQLPTLGLFGRPDPKAGDFQWLNTYSYCGADPVNRVDEDGMDWVEDKDGNINWRKDINAKNFATLLVEGEIYRGTSYTRDKIWLNVNVRGNSESGLMTENYLPSGHMRYKNNTPWVDVAVEELQKGISENGNNPEILKYFDYTQLKGTNAAKTDQTYWCAAFVNYCLEKANISGSSHALAYSFKTWGQSFYGNPKFGYIAIMNYSHVGFVIGQNQDGRIILLGGNQNDAVNLSPNKRDNVIKYVYPTNYSPSNLQLPIYNLTGKSLDIDSSR